MRERLDQDPEPRFHGGISRAAVRFSSEREGVVYTRALVKLVQEPAAAGSLRAATATTARPMHYRTISFTTAPLIVTTAIVLLVT